MPKGFEQFLIPNVEEYIELSTTLQPPSIPQSLVLPSRLIAIELRRHIMSSICIILYLLRFTMRIKIK